MSYWVGNGVSTLLHKHVKIVIALVIANLAPAASFSHGENLQSRHMHTLESGFTAITLSQSIGQPCVQMHPGNNCDWVGVSNAACERSAYAQYVVTQLAIGLSCM